MPDHSTEQFPVVADEPGVNLGHPVRQARRRRWTDLAIIFAIIACSAAAAIGGIELATRHDDARINALEADRQARIRDTDKIEAQLKTLISGLATSLQQTQEALCAFVQREPPDGEMDRLRKRFGCGPYLPPGSPGRDATPTYTTVPAPSPSPSRPSPRPSPSGRPPPRTPTPSPSPSPSGRPPIACVLGLCVGGT